MLCGSNSLQRFLKNDDTPQSHYIINGVRGAWKSTLGRVAQRVRECKEEHMRTRECTVEHACGPSKEHVKERVVPERNT